MQGEVSAQGQLWADDKRYRGKVGRDSCYGSLAQWRPWLFQEEDSMERQHPDSRTILRSVGPRTLETIEQSGHAGLAQTRCCLIFMPRTDR